MVLTEARCFLGCDPSLDPFACHQFHVTQRYAALRSDPAALANDGLACDIPVVVPLSTNDFFLLLG